MIDGAASWLAASRPPFIWLRAEVSRCLRWASGGATRPGDATRPPPSKSADMKCLSHSCCCGGRTNPQTQRLSFIRRVWPVLGKARAMILLESECKVRLVSGRKPQQKHPDTSCRLQPPRPFPSKLIYFTLLMNFAAVPLVRPGPRGSITRGNLMLADPA